MNICYSGGAVGADRLWGKLALEDGQDVVHYSFANHKIDKDFPGNEKLYELGNDELVIADKYLKLANNVIRRKFPTKSWHTNNLLRRNFYQIARSESVYAIANLEDNRVSGGTAWAVQMFIDKCKRHSKNYPCFLFDQISNTWYIYSHQEMIWKECSSPPKPSGIWTGIGSRDITDEAIEAAFEVFGR